VLGIRRPLFDIAAEVLGIQIEVVEVLVMVGPRIRTYGEGGREVKLLRTEEGYCSIL